MFWPSYMYLKPAQFRILILHINVTTRGYPFIALRGERDGTDRRYEGRNRRLCQADKVLCYGVSE
jgi:hypothetical protein